MCNTSCFSGLRPGLVALCLLCGLAVALSACVTSPSSIRAVPEGPYKLTDERMMELRSWNLKQKAEAGDAQAQAALGWLFMNQWNTTDGMLWLRRSVEQGNADAMLGMALHYVREANDTTNEEKRKGYIQEAVRWTARAAQAGNVDAWALMGLMHANDKWGIKDLKKAKEWLQKAAEQGQRQAKAELEKLAAGAP